MFVIWIIFWLDHASHQFQSFIEDLPFTVQRAIFVFELLYNFFGKKLLFETFLL